MRDEVRRDLADSTFDFERVAWPVIKDWLDGVRLITVEDQQTESSKAFDMLAGIDFAVVRFFDNKERITTLASRVQWGDPWPSFTIRLERSTGAETEFIKRIEAIRSDETIPVSTVQAYVSDPRREGVLQSIHMVKTRALFEHLISTRGQWDIRTNPDDGNLFIVAWIDKIKAAGIQVRSWPYLDKEFKCCQCGREIETQRDVHSNKIGVLLDGQWRTRPGSIDPWCVGCLMKDQARLDAERWDVVDKSALAPAPRVETIASGPYAGFKIADSKRDPERAAIVAGMVPQSYKDAAEARARKKKEKTIIDDEVSL